MSSFSYKVLTAAFLLLPLAACADQKEVSAVPPQSRAKAVLDAQYAAESKQPPMQSAEADRAYDAYLEGIGKKSKEKGADVSK